jgi:hypothetical protein
MLSERGIPVKQRIVEMMEKRREAYARATVTIDTSDRTIEQVIDAVLDTIAINYPTIVHPASSTTDNPSGLHS